MIKVKLISIFYGLIIYFYLCNTDKLCNTWLKKKYIELKLLSIQNSDT